MDYQWYPGHMTKARRMMEENIGLVDLVIELTDARIPMSSRNPDIDKLSANKARILVMTKADLADPVSTAAFQKHFEEKGWMVVAVDARTRKSNDKIRAYVEKACSAKRERDKRRGIVGRPLRAMVVGIPNVGKSTFINSFAGKASAKTGNKPGVTRGKQWIRLNKDLELLDTPGILWPRFEDRQVGIDLALTGAIRQELLEEQELSLELLDFLQKEYPSLLIAKYGPEEQWRLPMESAELLTKIAEARKLIRTGGEPDYQRASKMILDDFRNGRIGRITLERPPADSAETAAAGSAAGSASRPASDPGTSKSAGSKAVKAGGKRRE